MTSSDDAIAGEILQLANLGSEHRFFGSVSEDSVREAESELGLRFPRSFRAFLRHFGAALMLGHNFSGLPDTRNSNDGWFSHVVDDSKENWRDAYGNELAPSEYIYITSDGGSYRFFLDTSRLDSQGECPVVIWGPGYDGVVVASDFLDFVRKLANGVGVFPKERR